ncbi:unnamed protein product [Coffea canephora]|uniref:Phytocyanin domain-containing protein n=1 Tax=Coffea canephora TaxID=49390 RepID=A0A068UQ89_COFCA|nr:unnamed protein product [Coffea canephora]
MAASTTFAAVPLLVILAAAILGNTDAATHVVGDSLGWTIPSGSSVYPNWASQQTFKVGDILVFNFATGAHDVAVVPKASYDGCTSSNPISLQTVGPARINLTSPGQAYFICTFGQHCSLGQKLTVSVSGASTPSTTPAPPTSAPAPAKTPAAATPAPAPKTPAGPAPTPASVPAPSPASVPSSSPAPGPGGAPTPSSAPGPGGTPAPTPTSPSGAPGGGSSSPPPSSAPVTATATATLVVMLLSFVIGITC